jgi:hypothetical protein
MHTGVARWAGKSKCVRSLTRQHASRGGAQFDRKRISIFWLTMRKADEKPWIDINAV